MNLTARITALEARPRESKGWRHFHTHGDGRYFENERDLPAGPFDYRTAIQGAGGPDTEPPGAPTFSQADVDALAADGWAITIIEYQDMSPEWYRAGLQNAQEGPQDAQQAR